MSRNTILLIVSSVLALLLVAFTIFFFNLIKNKNIHTEAVNNTLNERMKEKTKGSNLLKAINEAKAQNDLINSYFVNAGYIDDFVSDLEKNSKDLGNNAEVQSVDFSKGDKKSITIVLTVEGGFQSVLKNIKMIEYMPYAVSINSLSLNSNTSTSDSKEAFYPWTATVSFNIFTF